MSASRCEAFRADVTDEGDVRDAFLRAAELFGGVDIVVVNAGVARAGALADLDLEDFEAAVDVNLKGAFLTLREALFQLRRQGTGGEHRAGLDQERVRAGRGVRRVQRLEGRRAPARPRGRARGRGARRAREPGERRRGVRRTGESVRTVAGGRARSCGARGLAPEELEEFYRNRNLLKARVTPEHVGRAVVFFARQETPTTGAVLPVDGGLPDAFPR